MDRLTAAARRVPAPLAWFAVAAAVLVWLCAHQLTREQPRVAGTSGTRPNAFIAKLPSRPSTICQTQSSVPRAAAAVRLTIGTYSRPGPRLELTYRKDRRVVGSGVLAAGWQEGVVAIPLRARSADLEDVKVCLHSGGGARLAFAGEPDGDFATVGGEAQGGRISITGFSGKQQSTGSLLGELSRRIGRGSASVIGPWTVWAIAVLVVAAMALGGLAILRTRDEVPPVGGDPAWRARLRRVPRAGYAVAAAALSLSLAWSLLTPPFQVPDETAHFAYAQYLAETGKLPKEVPGPSLSPRENATLGALGFSRVVGRAGERVPTTASQERYLRSIERQELPAVGTGNAETASSNPPLYYALQAPVYLATSGGSLLTQLLAMRLLSVLFTTLSVLLAFLFARELLPRSPWAWTAAGLACAFQPVLGFVGSGVNPDSLLFLCATGTLLASARLVRRGVTTRRALLLAGFLLAGLLTKPLFLSLVPAGGLALLIAALRGGRPALRPLLIGAAALVGPMLVYTVLASGPLDHPYFAVASNVASNASGSGSGTGAYTSIPKELSFLLQSFLPRLPFLTDFVPGAPIEDVWINGLTGVFGWVDYQLPIEDTHFAVRVFELLLALTVLGLVRVRRHLKQHLPLAAVCLVALAGVLGAVGVTDYQAVLSGGTRFTQARYVLPLLALYGGLFALAARGLGARVAAYAVPALWVLVSVHTMAALVLTANRYYL